MSDPISTPLTRLQAAYDQGLDLRAGGATWSAPITDQMCKGALALAILEPVPTAEEIKHAYEAGRVARKNRMPVEYVASVHELNRCGMIRGAMLAGWHSWKIDEPPAINLQANLLPEPGQINFGLFNEDASIGIAGIFSYNQFLRLMEYLEMFKEEVTEQLGQT